MKNFKYKFNRGFTLIELILVCVVLAIIAVFAVGNLSSYRAEQTLRTEALAIVSIINDARSKTLASLDSSEYGVHIESGAVVSFVGDSFDSNDPDNIEHTLPSILEINNITISGGSDIIFERLSGETTNVGSFEIETTSGSLNRTISILATGQVLLD